MSYDHLSNPINDTPTIVGKTGAALANAAMRAVSYDATGNVVLATAGSMAMGIALPDTQETVKAGGDVHIQIKDIGIWQAGGSFAKGTELAVGTDGKAVAAAAGKAIVAIALGAATADGDIVRAQIIKGGYKA